ncbi:hypothetical protein, partial [Achromobacter xylosoxidans]
MTTTIPARDWELTCHKCDGSGHVYVKHQVAERQSDVQEFKEECECSEGRGFVFAFQDIPGIEEYVKACRPDPAAAGVSTVEAHPVAWMEPGIDVPVTNEYRNKTPLRQAKYCVPLYKHAPVHAPSAGDARDKHATHSMQPVYSMQPVATAFFTEKGEVAYTGIFDRTLKALESVKTTRMGISSGSIDLYAGRACAPAAGDALDLTLAQKYEDACIVANANAQDAERYRSVRNCPTLVMSYGDIGGGQDLDARVDAHRAAIAAQRKG